MSNSSGMDSPKDLGSSNASVDASVDATTVLIVGASIAGLACAAQLCAAGVDVHVYEQAAQESLVPSVEPGFAYSEELAAFCKQLGVAPAVQPTSGGRQVLDGSGDTAVSDARELLYTSWQALRSALLQKLPPGHYHASSKVVAVDLTHPTAALIELESGERVAGNLIVAADGINSTVRRELLPECEPTYAGYLAWRGVAHTDSLPGAVRHLLADKHTMFKGAHLHVHVYPLPDGDGTAQGSSSSSSSSSSRAGAAGGGASSSAANGASGGGSSSSSLLSGKKLGSAKDLRALIGGGASDGSSHSRIAWTWFNNQVEEELPGLLLDTATQYWRHAVPLGQLNPAVADAVVQAAADALPAPIAELMAASRACMGVSAVSDLVLSGCVIDSKLVLVGQAGSVIRPHTYTTAQQAVHDATSLAHALKASKFVLERALPRWEQQQVAHNVSQCRAAMAAGERMQGFTSC